MSSVETRQMSAVETGQMFAAETGHMSAVQTRQMLKSQIGPIRGWAQNHQNGLKWVQNGRQTLRIGPHESYGRSGAFRTSPVAQTLPKPSRNPRSASSQGGAVLYCTPIPLYLSCGPQAHLNVICIDQFLERLMTFMFIATSICKASKTVLCI